LSTAFQAAWIAAESKAAAIASGGKQSPGACRADRCQGRVGARKRPRLP
jgi:hypothetical protein